MDARSEEKRRELERALAHGAVMIHLDARRPGVVVPARLREDFHLRLNLSLRFDPPDLSVGEWGVRETLSFGGARFAVAVPWSAVFAITGSERSEQAWLYPEDMPQELFDAAARHFGLTGEEVEQLREETKGLSRADLELAPVSPAAGERPRGPALQIVAKDDGAESESESEPEPAAAPGGDAPAPRRGHLRLVK